MKTFLKILIAVVVIVVMVVGGVLIYKKVITDKTPPIVTCEDDQIQKIELYLNGYDKQQPKILETQDVSALMKYIKNAAPAGYKSKGDQPDNIPSYYTIKVVCDGKYYVYYVYEKRFYTYVEVPYSGIYKTDEKIFDILDRYFRD